MRKIRCFVELNLERKLNLLIEKKVTVSDIEKNGNSISFVVSYSSYSVVKEFFKNDKSFYCEDIGIEKIFSFFKCRFCCFLGFFLFLIVTNVSSFTLLNYKIEGTKTLETGQIIDILQENGYNIFSFTPRLNSSSISSILMASFSEISFASCVIKGNTLYVSIQETINDSQELFAPLYANSFAVVTQAKIEQGTLAVKVGDVVKKGDVLVYPYEVVDGEKKFVVPKAQIKGKCYIKGEVEYNTNQKILERTGNVFSLKQIDFLGINVKFKNDETFAYIKNGDYDVVKKEKTVNFLIPYKEIEFLYYELKPLGEPNYEKDKEELELQSKYLAYEQIKDEFKLESEQLYTEQINGIYYITTYLAVIKSLI